MKPALRLALLIGLIAAGGALAFAGAQPEGFLTVAQVAESPEAYGSRPLHLKASVVEGSLSRATTPMTFDIADGARTLEVRWDPAIPLPDHEAGGTIEGKNVVVRGTLEREGETWFLLAQEMTVGCASKYRPSE